MTRPSNIAAESVTACPPTDSKLAGARPDERPSDCPGWRIAVRSSALVVQAARDRLRAVVFLGTPDVSKDEVVPRLEMLLAESCDIDARCPETGTVQRVLGHIARELLDWRTEVQSSSTEDIFWAVVFVDAEDTPAFAHIGGREPYLTCDDQQFPALWRSIRTADGGLARAFSARIGRANGMRLMWSASGGGGVACVDALWGAEVPETAPSQDPAPAPTLSSTQAKDLPSASGPADAPAKDDRQRADASSETAPSVPDRAPNAGPKERATAPRSEPNPKSFGRMGRAVEGAATGHNARSKKSWRNAVIAGDPDDHGPSSGKQDPAPKERDPALKCESAPVARSDEAAPAPVLEAVNRVTRPMPVANVKAVHASPVAPKDRGLADTESVAPPPRRRPHGAVVLGVFMSILFLLMFAIGILIGRAGTVERRRNTTLTTSQKVRNGLGLGPGAYVCSVASDPPGATIRIDNNPLAVTTPADVELPSGRHLVSLEFDGASCRTMTVNGQPNDVIPMAVNLWGSVQVSSPSASDDIQVAMDGDYCGTAPIRIDHVRPGNHQLEFTAPGQARWDRAIEVRIGEVSKLTVKRFDVPRTGVIEVRSSVEDESGTRPIDGARVWIDGRPRGRTPLTLELPHGPHSVRGVFRGDTSTTLIIQLPGGNQRFANLSFGKNEDAPRIATVVEKRRDAGAAARMTATLNGVKARELTSMWLHVRRPDGLWGRVAMPVVATQLGAAGFAMLPVESSQKPCYYVSAQRTTGEEYFTEIQSSERRTRTSSRGATP